LHRDLALTTKIFADGADFDGIMQMYSNPLIKGFTTNPTLMRKAGIADYEGFARRVLAAIADRPNYAFLHYTLGHVLAGLGRKAEAILAYQEALRLDPSNGAARAELEQLAGPR